MFSSAAASDVVASALQHFDLVAIRILNEEKARNQRVVFPEFLDRRRRVAEFGQLAVHGVEIVGGEGVMTVAVTVRVGCGAIVVVRELNLEIVLGVLQINQGEVGVGKLG